MVGVIIAALVVVMACTSCNTTPDGEPSKDVADSRSVVDRINTAKKIQADKAPLTFGDKWTIYADGQNVGEVRGTVLPAMGDTYSLYSPSGNLVGSEVKSPKVVSHTAKIYDWSNQETGCLQVDTLSFMMTVRIHHGDTKVGVAEQSLGLSLSSDLLNTAGRRAWHMSRGMLSIGSDLTITREANTEVTGMDALWVSLVMSEIHDAESS